MILVQNSCLIHPPFLILVMLFVASLAPFVLLATKVAANPLLTRGGPPAVSMPLTKRVNFEYNGALNVAQRDLASVANLAKKRGAPNADFSESNSVFVYVAVTPIGSPPTNYELVVDTASANTWVGANLPYEVTQTSKNTSDSVAVSYGNGYFEGYEFLDTVTIGPGAAISGQPIGVALSSNGLSPYDGILAIGPNVLSLGSLNPDGTSSIPTITDNLFAQNLIPNNYVAISFEPTNLASNMTGELTFGGLDATKLIETPTSFPLTTTSPASNFWGVDATFRYSDSTNLMDSTGSGIIDSRASLIYLATDAYNRYVQAIGASVDEATGFLYIDPDQYQALQSLFFEIGGSSFELTPNAQIWPRALYNAIGGKSDRIYLVVQNLGQVAPGLDFICGQAFMERFYIILDTAGQHLGLATTQFTYAETN